MTLPEIIVTAGVGATFGFLIIAIVLEASSRRRARLRRIDVIRTRALRGGLSSLASSENVSVKVGARADSALGRAAARWLPRRDALRERLAQTGREISLGSYGSAVLLCMGISFVAGLFLLRLTPLLAGLSAVAVGVYLPHLVVGIMVSKRASRFLALFPDAIELMVRGLKSGLPITETVVTVGQELADPVGIEFRRAADAVRLGQTLEDALWSASKRIPAAEFRFFVISLSIQRDTGGNLAETLGNLSEIVRKRKQMRLKIRAMSSEARASAYILGCLPFALFGMIMLLNPDYGMTLFIDPRGMIATAVALTLIAIAIATMYKMVKFEI